MCSVTRRHRSPSSARRGPLVPADAADSFASVVLMPPAIVAAFCDRVPMIIETPMQLAETWDPVAVGADQLEAEVVGNATTRPRASRDHTTRTRP
jgi:hypothetical protein